MKCTICGAEPRAGRSDLPFKVSEHTIVILKNLPVLECKSCPEHLIEDHVFARIEQILAGVGGPAELEVIRFAA